MEFSRRGVIRRNMEEILMTKEELGDLWASFPEKIRESFGYENMHTSAGDMVVGVAVPILVSSRDITIFNPTAVYIYDYGLGKVIYVASSMNGGGAKLSYDHKQCR